MIRAMQVVGCCQDCYCLQRAGTFLERKPAIHHHFHRVLLGSWDFYCDCHCHCDCVESSEIHHSHYDSVGFSNTATPSTAKNCHYDCHYDNFDFHHCHWAECSQNTDFLHCPHYQQLAVAHRKRHCQKFCRCGCCLFYVSGVGVVLRLRVFLPFYFPHAVVVVQHCQPVEEETWRTKLPLAFLLERATEFRPSCFRLVLLLVVWTLAAADHAGK